MGFFFLELLDDCDEESNNDDALASLDDAGRKLGSDSDSIPKGGALHANVEHPYQVLLCQEGVNTPQRPPGPAREASERSTTEDLVRLDVLR